MSRYRRSEILKMAANAHALNLQVIQGRVEKSAETAAALTINSHDLLAWLAAHDGQEVIVMLGTLADETEVASKSCRKCGRDYIGLECGHCQQQRQRIRGR